MKFVAISKIPVLPENKAKLVGYLEEKYYPFIKGYDGLDKICLYQSEEEVVLLEYWDTLKNAKALSEALIANPDIARFVWSLSVGSLEREIYKIV